MSLIVMISLRKRIERLEQQALLRRLDDIPSELSAELRDRLLRGIASEQERHQAALWFTYHFATLADEEIDAWAAATGVYILPADKYL